MILTSRFYIQLMQPISFVQLLQIEQKKSYKYYSLCFKNGGYVMKILNLSSFTIGILLTLLLMMFHAFEINAQYTYPKVKVTLKSGMDIVGKKGSWNTERLTMTVGSQQQTIEMMDIQSIMTKRGNAGKFAAYGAGGCCAIALAAYVASGGKDEYGEEIPAGVYFLGTAIWTGIFAGCGALIGLATDKWQPVYFISRSSSMINHINLKADLNHDGKLLFGFAYRF